ncbi:MAG: 3-oxoacyl-[acyl-carrier-protein] reductase [Phycisphaerae bacterium]|nr:3-oxoacyl-[acyl-carrier-protein] reductase [Phycisphaerae bacterium]
MMQLKEQVAIVTGASRGIGRAIALALAGEGATVVACARDVAKLNELAEEARRVELPGKIIATPLDVTQRTAIDGVVEQAAENHQRIDILINNAGITRDGLMMSMKDEEFEQVITANLTSSFWLTRAVSRHMVRARYGRIINIASVAGVMGNPGQANYSASKAGMIGLTKSVAKELGKRKITCNAVAPGFISTDMTEILSAELKENAKKIIPLARFGEAEEVAQVVLFLAGPGSSYITGQVILVDGGMHM